MLLMILATQAAAALPAVDFDLAKFAHPKTNCTSTNPPNEITVCAKRRATDIPIKPMPAETLLPKAEFKMFGKVRGKIAGEQGNVGPIPTNRAMVTMSVPF